MESDDLRPGEPTREDVDSMVKQLTEADPSWIAPAEPLELGQDLGWLPHRLKDDGSAVLHVHLGDRLRPYLLERMEAATQAGLSVHLAMRIDGLYDPALLVELASIDARVMVLDEDDQFDEPRQLLDAIAHQNVMVDPAVRTELGRIGWQHCNQATSSADKGRRLESLLSFLLIQIDDFRIYARNLRTETEELDVVVQQRNLGSGRCWSIVGAPFLFVEAKNWTGKVGQPQVTLLWGKMEGKRDTVKIGLLVGAGGFTEDARKQELRYAMGSRTIVLLGPKEIEAWIDSADGDQFLENAISAAMLR